MSLRRPRLKSYFRPLRRGNGALQLGLDPQAGAVVLEGLSEPEVALVCSLDGTRTEKMVYADALAAGIGADRTTRLLALLREHDLLVRDEVTRVGLGALPDPLRQALLADAQAFGLVHDGLDDGFHVLAARRRQRVLVGGAGTLPWTVATILRTSGVGWVGVGDQALADADLAARSRQSEATPPDLVILLGQGALDPRLGDPWLGHDIPHLPVVAEVHRVQVGPLLGRGPSTPCLHCLDRYRSDRDPAWATVLAQVSPAASLRAAQVSSETSLTSVAAGIVAMAAHSFLAGRPGVAGLSWEVSLPWPRLDHRQWRRHPRCSAHAPPPAVPGTPQPGRPEPRWDRQRILRRQ